MNAPENFVSLARNNHSANSDALSDLRSQALQRFVEHGVPDTRQEHWKYTDIRRLVNKPYSLTDNAHLIDADTVNSLDFDGLDSHKLVFFNGSFLPALSDNNLPDGLIIQSLEEAIVNHSDLLNQHIKLSDDERTISFTALNSSFLNQGVMIHVPENTKVEKPVQLMFISGRCTEQALTSQPRNIILLSQGAELTLIENYIGIDDSVYFTNTVTNIHVAENANCRHYKLQGESHKAYHIGSLDAVVEQHGRLESHSISHGSALSRHDIITDMQGQGSELIMNGLYVANGKQHVDHHTLVNHKVPNTRSYQTYRGVINDRARGVFNGKVIVHKGAQKTDATQSNANLLLSDHAEVDTKPELEIYADDVKCAHGATVGQLDENMLFYLRSRAIDKETAKSLLTFAFADEVIQQIDLAPIRNELEKIVVGKLPDANLIREFTGDQQS